MSRDARSRFYDSIADVWDGIMDPHELGKRMRLVFGSLLDDGEVRGKDVLDAGAGTGHFSRVLREHGAKLVSLDIGRELLARVREKSPTLPVCASLLELPFPDGSFDAVLCTEAVEHTSDPRRAVSELCRVLRHGGVAVLTAPNRVWHPAVRLAGLLRLRPYHGHEHWCAYRELRDWMEEGGLVVERHEGFNLLPHTFFCRPAFDRLDRIRFLHPWMINVLVRGRRPA